MKILTDILTRVNVAVDTERCNCALALKESPRRKGKKSNRPQTLEDCTCEGFGPRNGSLGSSSRKSGRGLGRSVKLASGSSFRRGKKKLGEMNRKKSKTARKKRTMG